MNSNYQNDRDSFMQRDVGSEQSGENPMRAENSRNLSYGRDNASMRGNDYYGTQGYKNDYNRGNYSVSTFGNKHRSNTPGSSELQEKDRLGGYAVSPDNNYIEFPDYSNRPTYGSYASSQAYTDFINHNYGYSGAESGTTVYGAPEHGSRSEKKRRRLYDNKPSGFGARTRFKSENQARYSKNDGRRR
ncbi:hypothetical protein [uncultured Pontibacter sp.]|uniref:hypothetical protein n=1 Tax=uncultured Pontibacter sp. TaxID=453356 RepID=UPI002606D5AF|nr:hypothetical protein [uncultured Pontibacter sp.]